MTRYVRMVNGGSLHLEPVHWDLLKSQQRKSFQLIQQDVYGILFALGSHAKKFSNLYIQPYHLTSCWRTQLSELPKILTSVKNLTAVTNLKINTYYFKILRKKLSISSKIIKIEILIHEISKTKYQNSENTKNQRILTYTVVHGIIVNQDSLEAIIHHTNV